MRLFILALMIALLPVRGWVGDAMATSMAAGHAQQIATKTIADTPGKSGAKAQFDHHSLMSEAVQDASDCAGHMASEVTAEADTNCESCSACQACHTVALSPATTDSRAVFHALHLTPAASLSFASADAALGQKPPIS